jgi:uncharacterized protein
MIARTQPAPKHRRTLGDIVGIVCGTLVFFVATIFILGWASYPYVNCFQAKLPPKTNIGHFERCVLGVQAVDENLQPIPWDGEGGVVTTLQGLAWPYFAWKRLNASSPENPSASLTKRDNAQVENDFGVSYAALRQPAERGDADAQYKLGLMYVTGQGVARDYAEAVKWYREAADQGLAVAQGSLAMMYVAGNGVLQDYVQAVQWARKAADQGDAISQFILGASYYHGQGVAKDYAEAVKWYRKAADQGIPEAQDSLGVAYRYGRGVPEDAGQALKWFRQAADQGFADAEHNLGVMYASGRGGVQDIAEAIRWFRKAADQGLADSQFNLGVAYDEGQGVPRDYVQAYKWFSLAVTHFPTSEPESRVKATKVRDLVAAKMTPAQIAEATKFAREWKPE